MKRLSIILIFQSLSVWIYAQTTDMGMQFGIDYSKKLNSLWKVGLEEEIRFNEYFTQYERFKSTVSIDYALLREKMKVGISYDYINKLNNDDYYENRNRINTDFTYSEKVRQFKFAYRARFQAMFRDETRGSYTYNPKIYMRNKFEVEYSLRNKPFKLFLSTEFFWRLNHPSKNIIDEFRTTAGIEYRINKSNAMLFYVRSSNEIQVNNPLNFYSFGVVYKCKH